MPVKSNNQADGVTLLFSFPYWLIVDNETPPKLIEITLKDLRIRFYPPFRSAPANFIPMPAINPRRIPFPPNARVKHPLPLLPTVAAVPNLGATTSKNAAITLMMKPQFKEALKTFPMDSLRIDVFGGPNEDATVDQVREYVSQLIQLLRFHSRQWWIEHTADVGTLRNTFPVNSDGTFASKDPYGHVTGATSSADAKAIDESLWQKAISDLGQGEITPLYDLLILDARYFGITGSIRRSILDSAIACEQARDVNLERVWNSKAPGVTFKVGRILTGNNLPNHLSKDLDKFIQRSYEKEHSTEFAIIEDLWDARGSIAHGRPNQFFRDGRAHVVDTEVAKSFCNAAENCIRWLESL